MSISTHIVGFRAPDDQWMKHVAVWEACKAAGVPIPAPTSEFFNWEDPTNKEGMEIDISAAVEDYHGEYSQGFQVDITKLPKDVHYIRFYNSC